eukprot:3537921-Rhodomonas_salina.1
MPGAAPGPPLSESSPLSAPFNGRLSCQAACIHLHPSRRSIPSPLRVSRSPSSYELQDTSHPQ